MHAQARCGLCRPSRFWLLAFFLLPFVVAACESTEREALLSAEEQNWIKVYGPDISVGVSIQYLPYESYDLDNRFTGISADYLTLIGHKVGLHFKPVRCANRDEAMDKINKNQVMVVGSVEKSLNGQNDLHYTKPYINIPAAMITRKEYAEELNLDKIATMKVGSMVSADFNDQLNTHFGKRFDLMPTKGGYIGGLRTLAVGDIDVFICDMALASNYIAKARISNLRIAGITPYTLELRFAVSPQYPELASIMDKALTLITLQERKTINEQWLNLSYTPFWLDRSFWISLIAAVCALGGGVVLILVWNRSLKRQVAWRTATLSAMNRVFLGSLECRTLEEVMRHCLREVRTATNSQEAFWARLEETDAGRTLVADEGDASSPPEPALALVLTAAPTLRPLAEHKPVIRFLHTGSPNDSGHHVVILPLQELVEGKHRVMVVTRSAPYSPGEIALLTEVLTAFEMAWQRKRAEILLLEKNIQLQRAQRMESLGTLAGGVAHDFNNILGIIIANGEMIEIFEHDTTPALAGKTEAILNAAYRGRDLVKQILSFARKGRQDTYPIRISPILGEAVDFLKASLPASIRISTRVSSPEYPVQAESTQMHQVLMNLCTNAAHALGKEGGEIIIEIHADDTPPEALPAGQYMRIRVRDTGPGIAPELVERIFEPFFTTKAQGEGSGLGLAVVEGIVKSWGGTVQVKSTPGHGAAFYVFLPAQTSDDAVLPQPHPPAPASGSGRILLVDDESDLVKGYQAFLNKLGYQALVAPDSETALQIMRQNAASVDLLITDYGLPGIRGDALAREMRRLRPDMPIIVCTGYSRDFGDAEAAALGVDILLKKPVSLRELALAVRRYLRPPVGENRKMGQ